MLAYFINFGAFKKKNRDVDGGVGNDGPHPDDFAQKID